MKKLNACNCSNCMFDCFQEIPLENCVNYQPSFSLPELKGILKNTNIVNFCKQYKLKIKYLNKMLYGDIPFNYKYLYAILDFEKRNDKNFEFENVKTLFEKEQESESV